MADMREYYIQAITAELEKNPSVELSDKAARDIVSLLQEPVLPPPITKGYIGKHEKTAGGVHHDGSYR